MERDGERNAANRNRSDFNSHAHVERDQVFETYSGTNNDFNSHAHVERDSSSVGSSSVSVISTHTLTWSVTQLDKQNCGKI